MCGLTIARWTIIWWARIAGQAEVIGRRLAALSWTRGCAREKGDDASVSTRRRVGEHSNVEDRGWPGRTPRGGGGGWRTVHVALDDGSGSPRVVSYVYAQSREMVKRREVTAWLGLVQSLLLKPADGYAGCPIELFFCFVDFRILFFLPESAGSVFAELTRPSVALPDSTQPHREAKTIRGLGICLCGR